MKYRTAIITGASRGLGSSLARSVAARGLNVMLAARSAEELRELQTELEQNYPGKVDFTPTDIRDHASIPALFEAVRKRFGPADVLINNAGIGRYKPFLEWTDDEIVDTVNINLTALMLCTRAALPDMLTQRRGLIINIGSDLSRRFLPLMAPYTASKFGVLGFGGSLSGEVRKLGVKVCTVMPGMIDTWFNNSEQGSRDETWALDPRVLAEQIAELLDQPEHVIIDEMVIHPAQQDY